VQKRLRVGDDVLTYKLTGRAAGGY
jgi:hypothetical protein